MLTRECNVIGRLCKYFLLFYKQCGRLWGSAWLQAWLQEPASGTFGEDAARRMA